MNQSNVIAGALLVAFIVFITVRGELPTYINLLRGNVSTVSATNSTSSATASTNSVISGANTIEKQAEQLIQNDGIQVSGIELGQF